MSKVAIVGDPSGTGTFTISAPNGNTDRTLVLPDEAGTVLTSASNVVTNSGPAFRAYMGGNQTPSVNTWTTIAFNTEEFDTDNCFNTSTYTFTPTVAGYYQFNVAWLNAGSVSNYLSVSIAKNGTRIRSAVNPDISGGGSVNRSALVYMNGTTDSVVAQGYTDAGTFGGGSVYTAFEGVLVRKS